jgi:cupin superfamily acireductone dioxygenase involved in methionine salvage
MAILYVYKNKEIEKFIKDESLINSILYQHGIYVYNSEFTDLKDYIKQTLYRFSFMTYDIFTIRNSIIEIDSHHHEQNEGRMILKGQGRFYFEFSDYLMELHVAPGDFVFIPAFTKHYFKCLEAMVVMRFFGSISRTGFEELE